MLFYNKMSKRFCFFSLLLFLVSVSVAQRTENVDARYIYRAPENVTLELAKRTAFERAKIQAIADAFGTLVTQTNYSTIENVDGKTNIDFTSIGGSDVKGEWIETIDGPHYEIRYEEGMLIIECAASGKIREYASAIVNFDSKVLAERKGHRFECEDFKSGDGLLLSFRAPTNGCLAVYLQDADNQVYCLLPYRSDTDGKVVVEHDKDYLFFSKSCADKGQEVLVDEYIMTAARNSEVNQIHVIFSPNDFVKASDSGEVENLPRSLSFKDFAKWLARCRVQDSDMRVETKLIKIKK